MNNSNQSLADTLASGSSFSQFSAYSIMHLLLGLLLVIGVAYLISENKRSINWKSVGLGLAAQVVIALSVIYFPFVQTAIEFVGKIFISILSSTEAGAKFLFGDMLLGYDGIYVFATMVLPVIIFMSALSALFFYWGVIQLVVKSMAKGMVKLFGLSGVESLSVAGNIFLGQTESPLMIKPYLKNLNRSQMFVVMTGGMATIAGSVLAAYIGLLSGGDPALKIVFAKHLITASVMAAPAVVVVCKIIIPQTEAIEDTTALDIPIEEKSALSAISRGTSDGLRLAANVGAMILVFIAVVAMVNMLLGKIGDWTSLNDIIVEYTQYDKLSLQMMLGYIFAPVMWLIGVPTADIASVGQLLGEKIVMNEFIGYISLTDMVKSGEISYKSVMMGVYLLCGFANIASIGIQVGGIGLLAPERREMIASLGVKALIAGTLTALLSATIIGVLV